MPDFNDWDRNDTYKIQYKWNWDLRDYPETIRINEYVNDELGQIIEVKESLISEAVIEILRAKGYTVIDPKGDDSASENHDRP